MAKFRNRSSTKQGISSIKKKNIRHNKLAKQGFYDKEARKQRRKERRKDERMHFHAKVQESKKREAEREPDYEVTGDDMMEMIDPEDMEALLESSGINEPKKKRPKKEIKKLLPIRTEDGWEERQVEISREEAELTLTKYKRTKKQTDGGEEEADSGICDDEEVDNNIDADDDDDDELEEEMRSHYEAEEVSYKERSVSEILAERNRKLHSKKVQMACLASNLLENPFKLANMRMLLEILGSSDPLREVTVQKYCALTILQVFHNIIPGYRIQEKNLEQKMKKETLQTAKQEIGLLNHYRKYLQLLESFLDALKEDSNNLGLLSIARISVKCLGDMLVKHPTFNYSVNIIQALVPYLNNSDKEIRAIACSSLSQTVRNDKNCYLAVEVVRKIYKLIHRLKFKVKNEALEVFMSVRVHEMKNSDSENQRQRRNTKELSHKEKMIKKLNEQAKIKPSRKQKKEKKKMAKLREQMAEINAIEIQNITNVRHSEILQTIFGIYFHILKKRPNSKLMGVVLKGLAKFAHLINMEFFSDLLALMNGFLEKGMLSKREALHCIQTVFTILSGQGETLNIDPNRFYKAFYSILIEMRSEEIQQNIETILQIFNQMLIRRKKKVSSAMVLSFAKRLAMVCQSLPHHILIPSLVTLKTLMSTFSYTEALLDPDSEGAPGIFQPEISDPEHANATTTALWELHKCLRHYHPTVRLLAASVLSSIPAREMVAVASITQRSTEELLKDFAISSLKLKPSLPHPDAHLQNFKKRKVNLQNVDVVYKPETKRLQLISQ